MDFGSAAGAHIRTGYAGLIQCSGVAYDITGSALSHLWSEVFGASMQFLGGGATVTIANAPSFSNGFAYAGLGAGIINTGYAFSGDATGARYVVNTNSVIATFGGGPSYFPGSTAGGEATGGQYT